MSLESAIEIFTKQNYSDPKGATDIIQKAQSLNELKQIMADNKTYLSSDQFVNFRISSLFESDSDFAKRTLETAKEKFRQYDLPEEVVAYYISKGGGCDIAIATDIQIELGNLPKIKDRKVLLSFFDAATDYLFQSLRNYVNEK